MYEHQGKGTPVWTSVTLVEGVGSCRHFDILRFLTGVGMFRCLAQSNVFFVCAQLILFGSFHLNAVVSAILLVPSPRQRKERHADVILLLLLLLPLLLLVVTIY